eukprot:jgi/Botrbrau1/5769/Bobra.0134s0036.1
MEDVARAIEVLHNPYNSEQSKGASLFLNLFAEAPEAWEISVGLLDPSRPAFVQFFVANVLLTKARREWSQLSQQSQSSISAAVSAAIDRVLLGDGADVNVLQRLAMALACFAVRGDVNHLPGFLEHAISKARTSSGTQGRLQDTVALEMLRSLAEEAASLAGTRRLAVIQAMGPHSSSVFSFLATPAGSLLGGTGFAAMAAWLKLDPYTQCSCISPSQFQQVQGGLMGLALEALSSGNEKTAEAAADALVTLLGPGKEEEGDQATLLQVLPELVKQGRAALEASPPPPSSSLHALARVATAIAERDPYVAASPQAVGLAQMLIGCLQTAAAQNEWGTVESVLEYFDAMAVVPLKDRAPELQVPLSLSLMQVLCEAARYPSDFCGWDSALDDPDEFFSFREHVLADALEVCQGVLRLNYLVSVRQLLFEAASHNQWQPAEAAIFALRCVASEVNDRSGNIQDRQQAALLLQAMFSKVVAGDGSVPSPLFVSVPWLLDAGCQLITSYAGWFSGPLTSLLDCTMRFVLTGLQNKDSAPSAAKAFQRLCCVCPHRLNDATTLSWLLNAADTIFSNPGAVGLEQREAVVTGLGHILSVLPAEEAGPAALRLVQPMLRSTHEALQQVNGTVQGQASHIVEEGLLLVAATLRLMAVSSTQGMQHPALPVLQAVWPLLSQIMQSPAWLADQPTVAAMCQILQRALLAISNQAAGLVEPATQAAVAAFQACAAPESLETLAVAAEAVGSDEAYVPILASAIRSVSSTALAALTANPGGAVVDQMTALFRMANRCLIGAPAALLSSGAIHPLLGGALQVCGWREMDPLRASLNFITSFVGNLDDIGEEWAAQHLVALREEQEKCLKQEGKEVLRRLLWAAAETCPPQLAPLTADPLLWLITHSMFGEASRRWVFDILASADFPGHKNGRATMEDCSLFCELVLKTPPLSPRWFAALLRDFGSLCQGEGTSDALLAYQL